MQKSKVATAVVVVLAAAWVGGSWYTGKLAESEYKHQIEMANEQIAKSLGEHNKDISVKAQNVSFERGWFSSQLEDNLVITINGEEHSIPFSSKLYHGPLPLDRLAKFNLMPTMLSVESELVKNEFTQQFFDVTKGENPLTGYASTSYGKHTQATLKLAKGEYDGLTWSDIIFNVSGDPSLNIEADAALDTLTFKPKGKSNDNVVINGFKMVADYHPTKWKNIYTGKQTYEIASINVDAEGKDGNQNKLVFNNFTVSQDVKLNDKFVDYKIDGNLKEIQFNGNNVGKLNYKNELNHLDADTLDKITTFIQTFNPKVTSEKELTAKLQEYGVTLLQTQPQLVFNPVELETEKGKLTANVNIALGDVNLFGKKVLDIFNALEIHVNLDKAAMEHIFNAVASEEERKTVNIQAQIDKLSQEMQEKGTFVNHEKNLTLDIKLENGKLMMNGKEVPEEQIQMFLFLLAMGMAH